MTKTNLAHKWASKVFPHSESNEVKTEVTKTKKGKAAKVTSKVVDNILGK